MKALIPKFVNLFTVDSIYKLIGYDKETNTILINNEKPLNIAFTGPVRFVSNSDFEIETNGQFDVVTHGKTICLDALQSKIYFNSRRTKHCMKKADRFEGATRKITDGDGSNRHRYDQLYISQLEEMVFKLTDRVNALEDKSKMIEEK